MKWLVPNWERAVGPAFWIYRLRRWWWREMNPHFYGNLRWEVNDFFKNRLLKWLTPHLRNARNFMEFCIQQNGTKLLDHDSMSFYIRSRDGNQYYFLGRLGLHGRMRVWKRQWVDGMGDARNLFLYGVVHGLCGEEIKDEDNLVLREELVFDGTILTRKQLVRAKREILKCREFDWSDSFAAMSILATELGMEEENFTERLLESVIGELFPDEKQAYWRLDDKRREKVDAAIVSMDADEARRRIAKKQEK